MKLPPDLKEFIELLNKKTCRYLIIGGWAYNYYADARPTGDYDFFVPIDQESELKLRDVLTEFGFGSTLPEKTTSLLLPNKVLMLGNKPLRIDILTTIDNVQFEEAWVSRVSGLFDGIPTFFIDRDLLIKNKSSTGREKDLRDVAVLQCLKKAT